MQLIFDFDGTITEKDTISVLVQSAIAFQEKHHGRHLQATWDTAVQNYLDDYRAYKTTYRPTESQRHSVAEEVQFLSGLKDVENASVDRVGRSGIFSGLRQADLFQMGVELVSSGNIVLRSGFKETVELAERKGWGMSVLSVNWSQAFIEGVLHPLSIPVVANEIDKDGHIKGPELLGRRLTASSDKATWLRREENPERPSDEKIIYFGDSITDMECLLLRGGIAISTTTSTDTEIPSSLPSSSLVQTLSRVGVGVSHVGSRHDEANRFTIYWARDFNEVLQSGILD